MDVIPTERLAAVELLVLDVDGVLTDGSIVYTSEGVELKSFHVRDGSGLKVWLRAGYRAAVLSGRRCKAVDVRAAELGLWPVVQGAEEKLPALRRIWDETGIAAEKTAAVGDDLADLPLFAACGVGIAVADACAEALAAADYVTEAAGGRGAVREVVELLLKSRGRWLTG